MKLNAIESMKTIKTDPAKSPVLHLESIKNGRVRSQDLRSLSVKIISA